jgi:NAD-dependent DNA ligase
LVPDATASSYIVKHGGSVGGVSKKTTVLFAASDSSGKAKKADALGVPVVSKAKMWDWLKKRGEK